MLKKRLRSLVGVLLLVSLVSQPLYSVSLSKKETAKIEDALKKSEISLMQQEIVINQLSTELKKQSESYRKLKADKFKSNVITAVTCFVVGGVVGGVAAGTYVWLHSN